jgi:protein-disulfide isomerase
MTDRLSEPVGPGDHLRGSPGADLELVMYGDFECPYCTAAQSILDRVRERLGDRLRFVFRHFPLEELHPHARQAAEAAEAAAAQDAFWEMHDALYAAGGRAASRGPRRSSPTASAWRGRSTPARWSAR